MENFRDYCMNQWIYIDIPTITKIFINYTTDVLSYWMKNLTDNQPT